MKNILLVIWFYFQNSHFNFKIQGAWYTHFSLAFAIYLVVQSSIKLNTTSIVGLDYFNWFYLLFGIGLTVFALWRGFMPSYKFHKSLKENFEYESIFDYYAKNQFI